MAKKVRYSDLVREVSIEKVEISYNDLIPKTKEKNTFRPEKVELRTADIYKLLKPYLGNRFQEQFKSVVPLALYLLFFQIFILRQAVTDSWMITGGLFAVILGLMLFMEGLKLGLMPFGEMIGNTLPVRSPLWVVLLIAFILGIGVTFAEPAIGALKTAGSIVDVQKAPYLFALLNQWTETLVLIVGIGVGLAAVLGTLRFLYGWSLKPLILITLTPLLILTFLAALDPHLEKILGLAWDCGAVTTGPVTVPLVLSLGIGVAASAGKGNDTLSGFGIVTLASLFPILGVVILSFYVSSVTTPEQIIALAQSATQLDQVNTDSWMNTTPGLEIMGGIRSIVPLVLFLLFVLKIILKEKVKEAGITTYGIILSVIGMIVFNLGLTYGLSKLGQQSGSLVPGAFTQLNTISDSPLFSYQVGLFIALLFAWILGFWATLAEPALNALGMTVENLTSGAFKKSLLMYSVSFGVALGLALGVMKVVFTIPILYLVIPGYALALILTLLSNEEFVNVAWDSAGVTTGPVTVPLVLSMGLGFGEAMNAIEGFGILSMASICPILSVLTCGLWIQYDEKKPIKGMTTS